MNFFILSKLLRPLLNPLHITVCLAVIGSLLMLASSERFSKAGRGLVVSMIVLLLAIGVLPVGDYWLNQLESEVTRVALPTQIDGIIVLGGMVRSNIYASYQEPILSEHSDRLRCFMQLSRRYPQAKLLFTGGSSRMLGQTVSEAPAFAELWQEMGGEPKRLIVEDQSRNTLENVLNSQKLVQPQPSENWVLITSAYHMPRALAVFQRAGWPVLPYPCDYQTAKTPFADYQPDMTINWLRFARAWKEWLGSLAYRWHGT